MSIFYKITAPNGAISYLFGTIHINDEDVTTLPLEVKQALEQATACIFELESQQDNFDEIMLQLVANWRERSNSCYIPRNYILKVQEYFNQIRQEGIEKHLNLAFYIEAIQAQAIDRVPPILVALDMISNLDASKLLNGLDQQLMQYAAVTRKELGFLESCKEQLNALNGFNFNIIEQIAFYDYIESERANGRKFLSLQDVQLAYQQQDLQKMRHRKTDNPIVDQYYAGLIQNRDVNMAQRMVPYLNNGNAFVAVGAAHLEGIVAKLRTQNYTIEAVPLGKRYYPIDGTIEDGEKVAAFRKIYTALYMAQTSFFKRRGFLPTDDLIASFQSIEIYTNRNSYSRSAKAWELANKHYKYISSTNNELLKEICQEGYAKSSSFFGLFRQTKTNLDDAQSVEKAAAETRTGTVRDILDGAAI